MNSSPTPPKTLLNWLAGDMRGRQVSESQKSLGNLKGIFIDEAARGAGDPGAIIYRVRAWQPVEPGTEGGLFWGVTTIEPGTVGDEFHMTHGHFHAKRSRGEYYVTAQGEGLLMLMDDSRKTWTEAMSPGSLHFIDGRHAHRAINTGKAPLIFWACWPSDAGYDYGTIAKEGFGARVFQQNGRVVIVPEISNTADGKAT